MWYIYDHEKRNADSFLLPCNINSTLIALNVVSVIKEEYSGIVPTEYKDRIEEPGRKSKVDRRESGQFGTQNQKIGTKKIDGPLIWMNPYKQIGTHRAKDELCNIMSYKILMGLRNIFLTIYLRQITYL